MSPTQFFFLSMFLFLVFVCAEFPVPRLGNGVKRGVGPWEFQDFVALSACKHFWLLGSDVVPRVGVCLQSEMVKWRMNAMGEGASVVIGGYQLEDNHLEFPTWALYAGFTSLMEAQVVLPSQDPQGTEIQPLIAANFGRGLVNFLGDDIALYRWMDVEIPRQ
nr:basic 7S globulin-like [Ipomoea batatas]